MFFMSLVRRYPTFGLNLVHSTFPCPKIPHLRTQPCSFYLPLSKDTSSSDSTLFILPFLVRRYFIFGLNLVHSTFPCPKIPHLRTQPCSFYLSLSEDISSSDSTSFILPFLVRRYLIFRLNLVHSTFPCPKIPHLRTRPCSFYLSLSEDTPPSDSTSFILPFLVRRYLIFGLNLVHSTFPCPKIPHLRTQPCSFYLSLSEDISSSDSTSFILPFLVRNYFVIILY